MTIIRIKKTEKFSIVANRPFDTKALSWEARGVMGYLLTKPNNWEVKQYDLEQQGPAGKHKISRIVNELISAGFITRIKYQDDKGHWQWKTEVFEDMIANPETQKPDLGKPDVGKPDVGKPDYIIKTDPIKTDPIKTDRSDPPPDTLIQFVHKFQSLVGWNPQENGVPITDKQEQRIKPVVQWLTTQVKPSATIKELDKAKLYFNWMSDPPTPEQVKEHWAKIRVHSPTNGNGKTAPPSIAPKVSKEMANALKLMEQAAAEKTLL